MAALTFLFTTYQDWYAIMKFQRWLKLTINLISIF